MMRAASREATAVLLQAQRESAGADSSAQTLTAQSDEIVAVARLLVDNPQLRRTLADPSTDPDSRAALVGGLLAGRVSSPVVSVTQTAVRQRWSSAWDLPDALELTASAMLFEAALRRGVLDQVEDELFRFERILDAQGQLTTLLDEQIVAPQRRVGLLDSVLGAKVQPETHKLLEQAVASTRKRSIVFAIDNLLDQAAALQERSIARVLSASELSPAQRSNLTSTLSEIYGRAISLRVAVDPQLRGGLVIRVGDEIIDGSISGRLAAARSALAG